MENKIRWVIPVFWMLCLAAAAPAKSIRSILNRSHQKNAVFAISVIEADSGREMVSIRSKQPMIPASNMKIVTSAAALHYLGPDYKFETKIGLRGDDLVIIGGGDPLLGDPELDRRLGRSPGWVIDRVVQAVIDAGVVSVNDLLLDDSFFDSNRVHPNWPPDQLNRWYACEVSGINYYNNCVHFTVRRDGGRAVIDLEPATGFLTLDNKVQLVSSGSSGVGAYRTGKPNHLLVKGKLNATTGFDVAIENPSAFFGCLVYEKLAAKGIEFRGKMLQAYVKKDPHIRILLTLETPIRDVFNRCNQDSLSLAAEALVKTISAENTQGRINGEWPHGRKLIERCLLGLGVEASEFTLDDGGGLSRENRLSPHTLVTVLRSIYKSPHWAFYESTLASGGEEGTLKKYFKEEEYKGNIVGKTGYIAGVRTFSGICHSPRGDYLFSILTEGGNGYTRQAINDIAKVIYEGQW